MSISKLWNNETFEELALPALTTLFGLQMLRVLLPSYLWYLGDTVGVSYVTVGLLAFVPFLLAFLAAPLYRALGMRRALMVTAGGVALARLAEQFSPSPALDLVLTMLGTALFTLFFPMYLAFTRIRGGNAPCKFGRGILLGFVVDTTIHGAFGTLDLSWQPGFVAPLIVVVLVAALGSLLTRLPAPADAPTDADFITNLPLAALGPFVFVMAVVFQNIARATTLTGFPQPLAFGFIVLASAMGLAAALVAILPERATIFSALIATVFLAVLLSRPDPAPGTSDALYLFGNLLLFPLTTLIFAGLGTQVQRRGIGRAALANGIGWLLFVIFAFLYYIAYDIRTGIPNNLLPMIAVALVGLAALGAMRNKPSYPAATNWTSATIAFALLLVPLVLAVGWRAPKPVAGIGYPVRVMTYNVHNGFDTEGRLGLEALAQTIEQAKPDIVGLQEIARGWYVDGSVDMLVWLSQRLQMPYIFGPTADPVWGNAILSRYPIKEWDNVPLPPRTLPLLRGFLWARVDIGGKELLFIATHYHHVEKDTEIRQQQSSEIVKFWNQRARTILIGDLNATPDAREIAMLRDAGLRDAFAAIGTGNGFSWPSDAPNQRIDYIWFSSDLSVRDLVMPQSTASDHVGIAVTVEKK